MNLHVKSLSIVFALLLTAFVAEAQSTDKEGRKTGMSADSLNRSAEILTSEETMPVPSVNVKDYLNQNLQYPAAAKYLGVEGKVIVRFVIDEKGFPADVRALTWIGGGLEEEAIRVIKAMPAWTPGFKDGKPARVYYTLPIGFSLKSLVDSGKTSVLDTTLYRVHDATRKDSVSADSARVIVHFTVKANSGKVKDVYVSLVDCGDCDEHEKEQLRKEAIRVVSKMPDWKIHRQTVKYTLPIKFKLK